MKKVFILDDDEDIIGVLSHVLGKQYELYTQATADNLYENISSFKPDVIVMDNFIGQQNSHEILESLRNCEEPITAPVLLFSAAHNVEEISAAVGAQKYLSKPSSINEIRETIRLLIK